MLIGRAQKPCDLPGVSWDSLHETRVFHRSFLDNPTSVSDFC